LDGLNITVANKLLPEAGLKSFDWAFVQGSAFVLRLTFVLQIPAFGNIQTVTCKIMAAPFIFSDKLFSTDNNFK